MRHSLIKTAIIGLALIMVAPFWRPAAAGVPAYSTAPSSQSIYEALLDAPFPHEGLPPEVGDPIALPDEYPLGQPIPDAIGSVLIRDRAEYPYPMLYYIVFETDADVDTYFNGKFTTSWDGLPQDDVTQSACDRGVATTSRDLTLCLTTINQVAIVGYAASDNADTNRELAATFAATGRAHLESVLLSLTSSVPGASPVADEQSATLLLETIEASGFPPDELAGSPDAVDVYPWQDSRDDDLVGSLGGVIISDGDPFQSEAPPYASYIFYPSNEGALAQFDRLREGAPLLDVPEGISGALSEDMICADLQDAVVCAFVSDQVFVLGYGADAATAATNVQAALNHLNSIRETLGMAVATHLPANA